MADVQAEIEQVFRDYQDIWNSQDRGQLKELWDADDPDPFYLAEEQNDWRFGWEAVEKYWVPNPGRSMLDSMMMGYRDFHVKQIAPDLAICACWVRHDMKMKGPHKPTGGDARVMSVFRKKPEGWRFIAYAEGPLSPALYVMKLYEMNVSPEFGDFNRRIVDAEKDA
ncbi:MAG: nuclear transport factor 2 family protein [Gammaproteobacteria bacterium]